MISAFRDHLLLLPLLLFFIPPWFTPFSKQFVNGDANLIQLSCNQTVAPLLCTSCLLPDPRSDTADFRELIKIIIGCGCNQAQAMAMRVQKLALDADDIHQKAALQNCFSQLSQGSYHVEEIGTALMLNNIVGAHKELRAAQRPIFVYLDRFRQYPPVVVPPQILPGMLEFQSLCEVINRLINVLNRSTKPPMASISA